MGRLVWMGVGRPCPLIRNDIVTPRHLFVSFCLREYIDSDFQKVPFRINQHIALPRSLVNPLHIN